MKLIEWSAHLALNCEERVNKSLGGGLNRAAQGLRKRGVRVACVSVGKRMSNSRQQARDALDHFAFFAPQYTHFISHSEDQHIERYTPTSKLVPK